MNNVQGCTGLTIRMQDFRKPILTTSEYIGRTESTQDYTRIMNKVTRWHWSRKLGVSLQQTYPYNVRVYCIMRPVHSDILLVKLDIGPLRHYETYTRAQVVHNAYDYSQHVTLSRDASSNFQTFGDVTP